MIGDAARLSLKVLSNMNQEPESIWKKKWRVWRAFLIWFALFIFIVLGMMLIAGSAQEPPSPRAIFVAGIIGASVLLCLWLFGHWSTRCWRNLRRTLLGQAILATLIAMFYTEENWRGKRVWESCKRALETKGAVLDWDAYIPPPVPDEQNVFKAPKMQEWFVARGGNELSRHLNTGPHWSEPAAEKTNTGPVIVAELTIVPANANLDPDKAGATLRFDDPASRAQAKKLINDIVGPGSIGARDFAFVARPLNQIKPVHILLLADKAPSTNDVAELFPSDTIAPAAPWNFYPNRRRLRVESAGNNSFRVSLNLQEIQTAADYLAWTDQFQTDFEVIREALKRPYARMDGDYQQPFAMPIPNFVVVRYMAQTLAQRTQCYLLLGQSEKALRELTLIHDMRRLLEGGPTGKQMTLVAAMINAAVTGLYVETIADGMRLGAWREPQLAAIQVQLKQINLFPTGVAAFRSERAAVCHSLESIPATELANQRLVRTGDATSLWQRLKDPRFLFLTLAPRGWVYQNIATLAVWDQKWLDGVDLTNHLILCRQQDDVNRELRGTRMDRSPYTFLAAIALHNYSRAWQTLARYQTMANEAFVACALERYRLEQSQYPKALDALVPQFAEQLPYDIVAGQPLKYRLTGDGQFVLYSVGWNEKDDGGQLVLNKDGRPNSEQGDWVWRYPTAQ